MLNDIFIQVFPNVDRNESSEENTSYDWRIEIWPACEAEDGTSEIDIDGDYSVYRAPDRVQAIETARVLAQGLRSEGKKVTAQTRPHGREEIKVSNLETELRGEIEVQRRCDPALYRLSTNEGKRIRELDAQPLAF